MDGEVRAKRPKHVLAVFTENEVRALLTHLEGKRRTVAWQPHREDHCEHCGGAAENDRAAVRNRRSVAEDSQMIHELDELILECDLPEHGLAHGDVGMVVLVHQDGGGYEIEFTALDGETVAVVTLAATQVRTAASGEIAHARELARAS